MIGRWCDCGKECSGFSIGRWYKISIRFVRKCACFVLKCLSLFLVGDIKFVSEIEKDVEKNNTGA